MPICGTGSQKKNPWPDRMTEAGPITSILDLVDTRLADGPVDARALFDALGRAALVPALILPAMLIVSPLSAVPLFSSICGLAIIIIAVQGAWGRAQPWLPGFVLNRLLPTQGTQRAVAAMRRLTGWLDRISRRRLSFLVGRPFDRLLYLICALAAACIPFLELVPMSSTTIGTGVLLIAVGILTRDGLIVLGGLAGLLIAFSLPVYFISTIV